MTAPLHVALLLTMDCERVKESEFYPAGPASWRESERNISAFADLAERHGFRVTYFAVPEAAEAHAALFTRLIGAGHEVGMHLHPHTFRYGVNEYLGNLPADAQRALIEEASQAFESALGFPPTSFRPGHFSASADTFRVLAAAGFKRGSFGIPGRVRPGTGSDWRAWPPHCRYVEGLFEAPVTVHRISGPAMLRHKVRHAASLAAHGAWLDAARVARSAARMDASLADLRIEAGGSALSAAIVRAEVDRVRGAGELAAVTAMTHSYVNFSDERGRGEQGLPRRRQLSRLLSTLAGWRDCVFEPQTLAGLHRAFDDAYHASRGCEARPAAPEPTRASSFSHSLRS